ncbi:MAG: TRAP transporter substrate-binding protein DctP [Burkholderiaceae bacterium]|nr:TRAP transporter substrate-binding protein DctP [Burkholderiaceae bacterium]
MRKTIVSMAATAILLGGSFAAEAKTTLRLTLQLPLKSSLGQNVAAFKKEVEAASKGDLEIQIYDSAQLYKDKEVPQAVGSGAIEMGVSSITRFAGQIPAVDVLYVPFLFNTSDLVRKAVAPGSPVRGPIDAAVLKTGNRILWWQAYGSNVVLSKGAFIKTPADFKGKKARVFSKSLATWVSSMGGAPVNTAGSEQYLAYQRGTVDIGMTGPTTIKSRKIYEVMDHITLVNNAVIEFVVVINDKKWKSLTDAQRKVIAAAAVKVEAQLRDHQARLESESIEVGKKNGMKVHEPTADEVKAWKATAKPVIDQFLKASGALGKQVYEAAQKL